MSNPDKKLIATSAYPDMLIRAAAQSDERAWVMHIGSAEDLIASGAATAEMLSQPGKKGAGKGRVDSEGFRIFLDRYFVTRNGQPVHRYRLRRPTMPLRNALRLPGVAEALEVHARHENELRQQEAEWDRRDALIALNRVYVRPSQPSPARERIRGHLRLVVDNTKGMRT